MKTHSLRSLVVIAALFIAINNSFAQPNQNRTAWWQDASFGMFIHWGLYSIPARGEWMMYQEHVPVEEYKKLADQFNPQNFNPDEWVALAKDAGMKYIVITTRHHDGFCLFDSKVSDFTAPKTAAGRDLIAEFVAACRKAGMRFGFYYSLVDWRFPGTMPHHIRNSDESYKDLVKQAHNQVRELLTNYGTVDILWYDMAVPHDPKLWRSEELNAMARELQTNILINDRAGIPGDFSTPENSVSAKPGPWESCYSMNRTWGYAKYDRNYKSGNELIRLLCSCASQKGNFLLNVAPDGDGNISIEQTDRLREIGKWMNTNGKAIYNAEPSPIVAPNLGMEARVGNKIYLFVQRWPGSTVSIAWCGSTVKSAQLLANNQFAQIEQKGDRVWLHNLPEYPVDPYMNVIELIFEDEPKASNPSYN